MKGIRLELEIKCKMLGKPETKVAKCVEGKKLKMTGKGQIQC